MNSDSKFNKTKTTAFREAIVVAIAAALILLVPLLVMLFRGEMAWSLFDFGAAWSLLVGAGLAYKLVTRKSVNTAYKAAGAIAVATALFLMWSNLAVGIIGSENNPANLMYLGVLVIGLIGTFFSRFQPQGMAITLFAVAFAQVLVTVIALILGMHHSPGSSVTEILGVNGFFIVLWIVSALFYRYAGQEQPPVNAAQER